MSAVYNEIEPYAVEWLRELERQDQIARGTVDDRSVRDLVAADVRGAAQFHAFAGIGGWSLALRLAGWPDDRPAWTGSCPCQPFSSAGRRRGFQDDRHLWPEWFRLVRECRPPVVFGEQVASPDGLAWFDLVSADLEGEGYAVGAADLPAAGVGAPHKRQRLFFVAVAERGGSRAQRPVVADWRQTLQPDRHRAVGPLADAERAGPQERPLADDRRGIVRNEGQAACAGSVEVVVGDPGGARGGRNGGGIPRAEGEGEGRRCAARRVADELEPAGSGFWHPIEWVSCADGKSRPAQPGVRPLAHGVPGRVGQLRGYGNAIVPEVAATFVRAVMQFLDER